MEEFGNFQKNVGETSGSIGIIVSYIFAVIFGIIAIGAAIMALIPSSIDSSNIPCQDNKDCLLVNETCKDSQCQTPKKQKLWLLFISLFFVLLGFGVVLYSKWYNKWVHSSRENAQIGGAFTEFNMARELLK